MTTGVIDGQNVRESWCTSLFFSGVPHVLDALVQSVVGVFKRVIFLPGMLRSVGWGLLPTFSLKPVSYEISDFSTQGDGFIMLKGTLGAKDTVRNVMARGRQLATTLGLKQSIHFIPHSDAASRVDSISSSKIIFNLGSNIFTQTVEEIDFMLARELAQVALSHSRKLVGISFSLLCLDLVAGLAVSPWVIPLIEGISAPIENTIQRRQKLAADMLAMKVLNTSKGALSCLAKERDSYLSMILYHLIPRRLVQMRVAPNGDSRVDLTSPPLSKRVAVASDFQGS